MRRRNWSRASRLPAATSPGTPFFSFFPFFFSLVFFLFWPSKMEKSCGPTASRRGGEQQKPASEKKKMEPRAPETQPKMTSFWVGLFFFFKSKHPKTTLFWGSCFFLNQNTPKRRRFGVLDFFKKKKTTPPKRRRFGLPTTKTTPFCVSQP